MYAMRIQVLGVCFSVILAGILHGAEMEIRPGVTGIWRSADAGEPTALSWRAQWIWMNDDVDSDVMLARRRFELSTAPGKARLRISATSQYELHVNGEYVCRGPARSRPHHQSYDVLDVGGLLRKGGNALAVRVHAQRGQVSYDQSVRAGLLAQLDFSAGGEAISLATDSSWKVHPDLSWDNQAPRISRFHLEVCDRVDLRKQIRGWMAEDFDDTAWPDANVLRRDTGWPKPQTNARPQAVTLPWTSLVPRDIPYLEETDVRAVKLIEAVPITKEPSHPRTIAREIDPRIAKGVQGYRAGDQPLVLPRAGSSEGWFVLFDFGEVVSGRPQLDIEGAQGTVVDIMCAPYMLNDRFTANIVASQLIDRIVLSGRRDSWSASYFKPSRYLGITIRGGEGPVSIHTAGVRRISYPFTERGRLSVPEAEWIEEYWQASAKTIRVATTDAYTDNYRERRQYSQTSYYAALGNYPVFGDLALQRRYLMQVAQEQQANGMMPAYAPLTGDDYMIILDSNCLWVRGLRNYLLYSGDRKTARELLPAAGKLMGLLDSFTSDLGLLDSPPYPYWLDHALLDRRGANFCLNGHYLGALEDFAEVLRWLDEPGSEIFQARADKLRQSLRTHLWDSERRLFADALVNGETSTMFSEHANAMALAMDVATREQAEAIAEQLIVRDQHDFVRRESGIIMVTPAMSYFLHAGLCRYGYVEDSLRMFRERFDHMMQIGANRTLWEEWWLDGTGRNGSLAKTVTRSDAQTESAFPPMLFAEYLLGIRPTQPGLSEVTLFRSRSGLRQIEGAFPSPEGTLTVRWKLNDSGGGELDVEVPGAMRLKLDLASLVDPGEGQVSVDGRQLSRRSSETRYIDLDQGSHHVQF
ncbi:MAG: family 78 glycoside hydrolase catalytic domain [bacterium]|nr:family 78 glycoside hydrolase catalytic domain [bacterium]